MRWLSGPFLLTTPIAAQFSSAILRTSRGARRGSRPDQVLHSRISHRILTKTCPQECGHSTHECVRHDGNRRTRVCRVLLAACRSSSASAPANRRKMVQLVKPERRDTS